MEKHPVVLSGELTLVGQTDGAAPDQAVLRALDSYRFAPGERRQLINHGPQEARVLLALPCAPRRGD